nr:tyrosine-type recombinase/integrase [Sporosarcina limicola]
MNIDYEELDILDLTNEEVFDFEDTVEQAKETLLNYKEESKESEVEFTSNHWKLYDNGRDGHCHIFFEEFENLSSSENGKLKSDIVKCWIASLIQKNLSVKSIQKYSKRINQIIEISSFFDSNKIKQTKDFIKVMGNRQKTDYTRTAINFIDYYQEMDSKGIYTKELWEIKNQSDYELGIRELPSSQDILKFSLVVEDFFQPEMSELDYLKYYPVYLWWKLTTIIPLRISEFCNIDRNGLRNNDSDYYIKLPRKKLNNRRVQILDEIYIPNSLANNILEYVQRTDKYGDSKTLISYRSIPRQVDISNTLKHDIEIFNYRNMAHVLYMFYQEVVFGKYKYKYYGENVKVNEKATVESVTNVINRQIRLNDTRHFAFLNLITLGYHPTEIARLGGHSSIYSQYHYHQHLEYWVDSEVMELMLSFNYKRNFREENSTADFDSKKFKEKFILKPSTTSTKIPLKVGYCTDPDQLCKVDECYFCESWRIEFEDYKRHTAEIHSKIVKSEQEVESLIKNLRNLYYIGIGEYKTPEYSETSTIFNKKLTENAKQLRASLFKLASLKERVNSYE